MSEQRTPCRVVLLRKGGRRVVVKIELFPADQFNSRAFTDMAGNSLTLNNLGHYYRVRVNGAWYPTGLRQMFTKNQIAAMVKQRMFDDEQ